MNRRRGKAVLPSVNYWVISKIHDKPSLGDRKNTPQAQFVLSKNICSFTIISNICKVLRQYSTGNLIQQTHYWHFIDELWGVLLQKNSTSRKHYYYYFISFDLSNIFCSWTANIYVAYIQSLAIILNWEWIHYYTFVLYISMKPTFLGISYNRNMYDPMILLHIRTNYYFCWLYWYTRRLLSRIYKIILSRRVALLYFCVVYYAETCLFRHFIEQNHVWYYDISTYEN